MEENDFNFNEVLTLEELSTISVASQLLTLPNRKEEIEKFLERYYPHWRKKKNSFYTNMESTIKHLHKLSARIIKIASRKLADQPLPEVLKIKIQEKASEMGEQIFYWIMHLIQDLELHRECARNIYWTSNGLIDEDKIFKCFWVNRPVRKHFQGQRIDRKLEILDYLACLFAQEEFIVDFKTNFIDRIKIIFPKLEIDNESDIIFSIMKVVLVYYFKSHSLNSMRCRQRTSPLSESNSEVLNICISLSLYKPFIYFWNHLNITEQSNYLEKKSTCTFNDVQKVMYGKEDLFRIALFLMNEMSAAQKDDFILHNFNYLFFIFLKKKHLQKFCIPLLNKFLPQLSVEETKFLFVTIVRNLKRLNQSERNFHLEILDFSMERIPLENRQAIFFMLWDDHSRSPFNTFDIPVLKLIIHAKQLQDHRYYMVDLGSKKYKDLIKNNNFPLLNEFIDEVLTSENEKEKFKKDFNFLNDWISNGQFDILDKVLIWTHGDQARKYKIQLNHVCCSLVPRGSVNKLLKWYFETEEEPIINSCNDESLLRKFCRDLVYNMWFRSNHVNTEDRTWNICISTKILTTAFGSNEEISNFKKYDLAKDESCVRFLCKDLIKNYNRYCPEPRFDGVDKFFKFCSLTTEEIGAIKTLIDSQINDWIQEYGVRVERFDVIFCLLDWVYGRTRNNYERLLEHFQNHDELKEYYESREGTMLLPVFGIGFSS